MKEGIGYLFNGYPAFVSPESPLHGILTASTGGQQSDHLHEG